MSRQTLWRYHRDGEIEVVQIGHRVFLEPAEIRRFIAVRRSRRRPLRDEGPVVAEPSVEESAADVRGSLTD